MAETLSVEVTGTFGEQEARRIAALTDWLETEGIMLKVICAECLKRGHPQPLVLLERDEAGHVTLNCPHQRLYYVGPNFRPAS